VILLAAVMLINWTPRVTTLKEVKGCRLTYEFPTNKYSGRKSRLKTAEAEAGKEPIKAILFLFSFYLLCESSKISIKKQYFFKNFQ
jgi:hypothetical protein